ncbi:hypothetical protein MMC25_005429 [Agyrium rufum]|nr:hypothetical protein [Agyrium rufum]
MPRRESNKHSEKTINPNSKGKTQPTNRQKPPSSATKAANRALQANSDPSSREASEADLKTQQAILDVFEQSFPTDDNFSSLLQELKQCLFKRDFQSAFGRQDFLNVYAMRWSPTRALAYADLFRDLPWVERNLRGSVKYGRTNTKRAEKDEGEIPSKESDDVESAAPVKVVCLGAGSGAELVAFASYIHTESFQREARKSSGTSKLLLDLVDVADWSQTIHQLTATITTTSHLADSHITSKDSAPDPSIRDERLPVSFEQYDLLNTDVEVLAASLANSSLVTLLFTLNELYSTSIPKTTSFLLSLTYLTEPGSLLLVVDSPGSYSTVGNSSSKASPSDASTPQAQAPKDEEEGKEQETERRYPMQWLLDHTLLKSSNIGVSKNVSASSNDSQQWEKVMSSDSRWFRLAKSLRYPIPLEDMRYQYHLYRRL